MQYKIVLLCKALLLVVSLSAQVTPPSTSIKPQLDEVLKDFPNRFTTIKGKPVTDNAQNIEYVSGVTIKNALETKLIAYSNQKNTSWVWECRLFETENIDVLKRKYKSYYNDIAGKSLLSKPSTNNLVAVGSYSGPSEELRLWSNQFVMKNASDAYRNMVVDLVAEYTNFQWTIYLRVFDKEKDEEMRPTSKQ
jgi:hypothetical protein